MIKPSASQIILHLKELELGLQHCNNEHHAFLLSTPFREANCKCVKGPKHPSTCFTTCPTSWSIHFLDSASQFLLVVVPGHAIDIEDGIVRAAGSTEAIVVLSTAANVNVKLIAGLSTFPIHSVCRGGIIVCRKGIDIVIVAALAATLKAFATVGREVFTNMPHYVSCIVMKCHL
jgi:hypothetical protein